jgi:N-ethylmaleimide reductase
MNYKLFTPLRLGAHTLQHRVVLAPLTRMRASPDGNVPTTLNAEYYAQRTSPGGLLITEATPVSWQGHGHPNVPGIHTAAQVAGWRRVVDAVHARGGVFFMQLWHTGRVSHSSHQPDGAAPVGPSAIAAQGTTLDAQWKPVPYETPRALRTEEIAPLVDTWRLAALNAMDAGFDGVEIHGANGYLLEQFLHSRSNQRNDAYGGSIANRCRLHLEITDAVVGAVGAARTGIRLSPWGIANDSGEDEPLPLYSHLVRELAQRELVYLHLIEPRASGTGKADIFREGQPSAAAALRPLWPGVLIDAGGFDRHGALQAVQSGLADAVAFGRSFIANPDLPQRLRLDAPLNPYHRPTFYGGGAVGYTDYPALELAAAQGDR